MQVRLHAVRQESLARAGEAIFARVICAHFAARCKEHRPESNPRAELHNPALKRKRVEPEHRAIELSLPRCTSEWAAIIRRAIQIPRL
jgi:histidinol phosphatase-like enzyme